MNILYVVKNMRLANGVTSYAMNYYRELIKDEKINIDFLVVNDVGSPYYDEIISNGSNIHLMPSYRKNIFSTIGYILKLFKLNKYDIVHSHVLNSGSIILKIAKFYRVPVRILHAHATKSGDTKLKEIRNKLFISMSLSNANAYFACSKLAGDCLYKKRQYTVINNAIDLKKYEFNLNSRIQKRNDYLDCDKLVVMTVGRFTKQKNPFFIVDIISLLSDKAVKFEFWWFGNGVLENEVKKYAEDKKVKEYIRFFGANDKVNEFYSAADVFILPSLFEGLPVVGVEAQISGLSCIMSNKITKESKISELCEYIPIDSPKLWVDKILEMSVADRETNIKSVNKENYDINNQNFILKKKYETLCEENFK